MKIKREPDACLSPTWWHDKISVLFLLPFLHGYIKIVLSNRTFRSISAFLSGIFLIFAVI